MSAQIYNIRCASDELKSDREIVLAAVTSNGDAKQHASTALRYASEGLKEGDREIVLLAAVTQDDRALEYTSRAPKGDTEIILAAVTQDGRKLQHAFEGLKGNRRIVLAAVAQNGNAL